MDLIIYHQSCPDGFCAANIAKMRYPEAELLGMNHGCPPPYKQVEDKDVLVVDFSWRTREENIRLSKLAKSFHIYDHHKTAMQVLEGLDFVTFDMNRSGAGLTWDYLFGQDSTKGTYRRRPWYVNYVEDRDLWRHKLPYSKEVSAFIMTLPFTTEAWNGLDQITSGIAAEKGAGALAHVEHYVREIVEHAQLGVYEPPIVGQPSYTVAIVNAPYLNISEVGHVLATEKAEVGIGWFERGDGLVQFSLRSNGDIDVSEIAKSFGGGGHKNAAGFQMTLRQSRDFLDVLLGRKRKEIFEYNQ